MSRSPSSLSATSRRRFLQQGAAALLGAPFVTSGLRAASPNGKLRHAAIGASGMSWADMSSFSGHPMWELVAVCDVEKKNFARVEQRFPGVKCYTDWRELFEKESGRIDSVNVSIPDHMHGAVGIAAVARGLHVYGQKPLAQNLAECRAMTELARARGVMTQMGIQVSSDFTERFAVEMIHAGAIGKVKEVHTFSNKKWGDMEPAPRKTDPVPDGFDWDKWLGVATDRPFIGGGYYHPGNWRKRRDFGTGTLGDMGCHMFSGWFRALALGSPVSVTSRGPAPNKDNWAINGKVEYIFPGTEYTAEKLVKVTWYDGDQLPPKEVQDAIEGKWPGQGSVYLGTDGVLLHPHGSTPTLHPKGEFAGYKYPKLEPRNHWFDFIDCCLKGAGRPTANWDYSGPLTEAVLLGCLCSVFPEKTLEFDGPRLAFKNSPEATALVHRSYRKGWEIAGV